MQIQHAVQFCIFIRNYSMGAWPSQDMAAAS
jgi:hypothetical protein